MHLEILLVISLCFTFAIFLENASKIWKFFWELSWKCLWKLIRLFFFSKLFSAIPLGISSAIFSAICLQIGVIPLEIPQSNLYSKIHSVIIQNQWNSKGITRWISSWVVEGIAYIMNVVFSKENPKRIDEEIPKLNSRQSFQTVSKDEIHKRIIEKA